MMSRNPNRAWSMALGMTALLTLQATQRASAEAANDAPAATVVAVRGDVLAIGADKAQRPLQLKAPVFRKDTIKTGARGRVQIMFTDKTTISLGRNTVMELTGYEFKPEQGRGELVTHVEEGVFRVVGGALTKMAPENVKVETATATIGIRGSYFVGSLNGGELTVIFIGGIGIYISNQAGTVEIRRPNFGTVVRTAFSRPEDMRLFTATEIRALLDRLMGLGLGAGDDGVPQPQGQGDFDQLPGEPGFEGGLLEDEGMEFDEYAVLQAILDWLQDESTTASQNGLGAGLGGTVGGEPGTGPDTEPSGFPYNQHYGHAIGFADISYTRGSRTGYGSTEILQNYDDMYSPTDDPSEQFQFRTQSGAPGSLDGSGSLNLMGDDGTPTGPLVFAAVPNLQARGVGDYEFDATFQDSPEASVTNLYGEIRTATEGLGTSVQRTSGGTWWNWGVWGIDFAKSSTLYSTPETSPGVPAGYWVAGERTPQDYIRAQMNDPSATGSYAGGALCTRLPVEGSLAEYKGTSSFLVEFNARSVTGLLDFMQTGGFSMDVAATIHESGQGVQGTITNVLFDRSRSTPDSSSVDASFFGPTANSMGGTFRADMYGGDK